MGLYALNKRGMTVSDCFVGAPAGYKLAEFSGPHSLESRHKTHLDFMGQDPSPTLSRTLRPGSWGDHSSLYP